MKNKYTRIFFITLSVAVIVCISFYFFSKFSTSQDTSFSLVHIKVNDQNELINQNDVKYFDTLQAALYLTDVGIKKIMKVSIKDNDRFEIYISDKSAYKGNFVKTTRSTFGTKEPVVYIYPDGPITLYNGEAIKFKCYENQNKKCRFDVLGKVFAN